jgi:uncharacterized protein YbcI
MAKRIIENSKAFKVKTLNGNTEYITELGYGKEYFDTVKMKLDLDLIVKELKYYDRLAEEEAYSFSLEVEYDRKSIEKQIQEAVQDYLERLTGKSILKKDLTTDIKLDTYYSNFI